MQVRQEGFIIHLQQMVPRRNVYGIERNLSDIYIRFKKVITQNNTHYGLTYFRMQRNILP
jgi:hypothetical protein